MKTVQLFLFLPVSTLTALLTYILLHLQKKQLSRFAPAYLLRIPSLFTLIITSLVIISLLVITDIQLQNWPLFIALAALLITLACIDWQCQLLPDSLTLPLLWLGLLINTGHLIIPLPQAVLGASAGYLTVRILDYCYYLCRGHAGIGRGDGKLLAALGAWGGFGCLPAILLLSASSALLASLWLMQRKRQSFNSPLPFGCYLAGAGWLVLTLNPLSTNITL